MAQTSNDHEPLTDLIPDLKRGENLNAVTRELPEFVGHLCIGLYSWQLCLQQARISKTGPSRNQRVRDEL